MERFYCIVLLFFLFISTIKTYSQEDSSASYSFPNKGMYVGGQASTNGWGFDVKYIFNRKITLKSGLETLDISHVFNYSENEIDYDLNLDYNTGAWFLLADFNYTRNLYISIGAALNSFNPTLQGKPTNDLVYGDIIIPVEDVGQIDVSFSPGYKISPYTAVGFRSFLGIKERLTTYFETGFYYMGAPDVEINATGIFAPTANPGNGQKELFEKQFSQYQFYPMVKFSLALKLF